MAGSAHQTHDHHQVVVADHEYYQSADDHQGLRDNDMMEEYSEKAAPPARRKWYKRSKKYWIICSTITVILIVVIVVLALYVIFPKIAQSLMNKSKIDVTAAGMTFTKPEALANSVYTKREGDDMNSTFYMNMESALSETGPFHATIKFHNPVQIFYNESYLGDIFIFNETSIGGGHGQLNAVTPFLIRDQAAFTAFAKTMLAVEEFRWTLKGKLDITALSRTATVDLNKEIVLKGMNGFPNVKIESFNLPGDDPNGGILVELGTVLESPSPIGVELGTIKLAIGYDGVPLGTVSSTDVNLSKGENKILLKGTLTPHTESADLGKVGVLFSNYISGKLSNTTAVGLSCAPDGVNPIVWLSEGFKTVNLNVGLTADAPLKIINGVSMGLLDLKFDAANPYSPVATAPQVTANFQMPFGFSLNVTEVSQSITLAINTTGAKTEDFAVMQTPFGPAVSNQQAGTIVFPLTNTAIAGIPGKESVFNKYTYALTASDNYTFMINGIANTKAITPIGPVTLSGINFTVPTSLKGLQFLNSTATVINSLDVMGGTTAGLQLAINVTMENPSDFGISTGDVSFNMGASGTTLGLVTLSNLTLNRGINTIQATSSFDPKSSDVGQNLLSTFIMGADNGVEITGFAESTNIASLAGGLSVLQMNSVLPGLKTALIQGASMVVLPDTLTTSMVGVKVSIANPFSAGLSISKVISAATFAGMPVGNIDQDISNNPFIIAGKSTAESPVLSMSMNLEPAAVALLLRTLAVQANLDTRALDGLLGMGGFSIEGQEDVGEDASIFEGFNIVDFVMNAMKALKVDLSLSSTTGIGQYVNDLAFSQAGVAVAVDQTIAGLIPIVGKPIVQQIVDGSLLGFETIVLSDVTEGSFNVQMKGTIKKTGPMNADINFPSPLTISWKGKKLGSVSMPTINAKALVGATFDVKGAFTVANGVDMAEFAAFMINNESFEWEITTSDVSVTALGFTFTGISLHKFVTLKGANAFKDAVKIEKFKLPSNDSAGGITLYADTTIMNPSQIGFNLHGAAFESYFGDINLGPLASDGPANFAPLTTSKMAMKGRLIYQETTEGIIAITTVFGNYLANKDTELTVKGNSGSGPNGPVSWLTSAFQTIKIEKVILPGPGKVPTLIPAVSMKDLKLDFTKDPWNPPAGSNRVEAQLANPFGFPLDVTQLDMKVEANYDNELVATLDVPPNPATTSPTGVVTTGFNDVPFKVANKQLFAGFNKILTLKAGIDFGLKGVSNAIAKTAVGTLSLPGVPFDVKTHLAGFNNFNGQIKIIELKVTGASLHYVIVDLVVEIDNPSNITINVGDINFDVVMNEFQAVVGKSYLTDLTIVPGPTRYNSRMHLGEGATSIIAVGKMLTDYLVGAPVALTIQGTATSTKIAPLQAGISQVRLATSINGQTEGLIKKIDVKGELTDMLSGNALATIELYNPLDTPFTLVSIKASTTKVIGCTVGGLEKYGKELLIGSIDYTLPSPLTIPPKGTVVSDEWPVKLAETEVMGLLSTFADLHNFYNVTQNASVIVGDNFAASNMYYYQQNVPYVLTVPGITDQDPEQMKQLCMSPPPMVASVPNNISDLIGGDNTSSAVPPVPTATTTIAVPEPPAATTTEVPPPVDTTTETVPEPTTAEVPVPTEEPVAAPPAEEPAAAAPAA